MKGFIKLTSKNSNEKIILNLDEVLQFRTQKEKDVKITRIDMRHDLDTCLSVIESIEQIEQLINLSQIESVKFCDDPICLNSNKPAIKEFVCPNKPPIYINPCVAYGCNLTNME